MSASLECLFSALSVGEKNKVNSKNPLSMDLISFGGIDMLEKLQMHDSEQIYAKIVKIFHRYFELEDPLDIGL